MIDFGRARAASGYELLPGLEKRAGNGARASNASGTGVGGCSAYDPTDLPHGTAWILAAADGLRLIYDANRGLGYPARRDDLQ